MKSWRTKQINNKLISNFLSLSLRRALLCQEPWATNKSCSSLGSAVACTFRTGSTEPAVAIAVSLKLQPNTILYIYIHTHKNSLWANVSSKHKQPVTANHLTLWRVRLTNTWCPWGNAEFTKSQSKCNAQATLKTFPPVSSQQAIHLCLSFQTSTGGNNTHWTKGYQQDQLLS